MASEFSQESYFGGSGPSLGTIRTRFGQAIHENTVMINSMAQRALEWYRMQTRFKQISVLVLAVVGAILGVAVLIFHKYLIEVLEIVADRWSHMNHGKLVLFSLIFLVGFPPLIGFSALATLSGMAYGFPHGWPLLASASILGSFCSFLVFRYLLRNQAEKLVNSNEKLEALAAVLREESSLLLLILIRLCPLPYSLSNGALAAVPELSTTTYLLASIISSPKLLIHVFVGHELKELGDSSKGGTSKLVNLLSILITGLALSVTTFVIYNKVQQRLRAHRSHMGSRHNDSIIFGNFDDEMDISTNVELNSADFDEDNFIIADNDDSGEETAPEPSEASSHVSQEREGER